MKYVFILFAFVIFVASCSGDPAQTMEVSGSVKGLKKGVLYLQKIGDSVLVNLDSLEVRGNGDFQFSLPLQSPEIFYLYLTKADHNDINDRITFFGEPGLITINTVWNAFDSKAVISGSETQKKMEEFREVMSRFNAENLAQLQAANDSRILSDPAALDSLQIANESNIRRSYLYALNFAMNNPGSHAAPYIALTEVSDANIKYLDSLYNKLEPEVAQGTYGLALKKLIESRRDE
jgi:hypothetical protein